MVKTAIVVFALLFLCSSAYALEIAVGPTYQDLDLSGKIKSDGIDIDLENDLGMGDDKPVGLNLRLDGKKHHLSFDYASVEFKGAKTLVQAIQFRNKTYSVSAYVESKLKYDLYEAQYHYDLLELKKGENFAITISPLFKVSLYDATVNIKGGGYDETYSATLPLPSLGIAAQIDLTKYLSLLGQASGVGYSDDTYIEYKSVLRIKPIKYLNLDMGYKGMNIDYSDSNDLVDIKTKGLYLQGAVVFKF